MPRGVREAEFRIQFPFAGRDERVYGRLTLPASAGPHPAVLLANGYKSFLDWGFLPDLASGLARAGIAAARFNGSASGIDVEHDPTRVTDLERFARGTYSQDLEDLERVRAALLEPERTLDSGRFGLFGYSRGGGMALLHAAERRDYRAVAVWAPLVRVLRFTDEERRRWRSEGHTLVTEASTGRRLRLGLELLEDAERNQARLDIPAACRALSTPTLFVAAERDRAVGLDEIRALAACARPGVVQTLIVPGVGHGFGARRRETPPSAAREAALAATIDHFARALLGDDHGAK